MRCLRRRCKAAQLDRDLTIDLGAFKRATADEGREREGANPLVSGWEMERKLMGLNAGFRWDTQIIIIVIIIRTNALDQTI